MKKLFTLFLVFTLGISFAMAVDGGKSCDSNIKKSDSATAKAGKETAKKSTCDTKAVRKTDKKEKKQGSESAPI